MVQAFPSIRFSVSFGHNLIGAKCAHTAIHSGGQKTLGGNRGLFEIQCEPLRFADAA
jgi:hypothetical protein